MDARKGAIVLNRHTRLGAQDLGILATVGCTHVPVVRRPVVCVLTSGDEIRRPEDSDIGPHQIRNAGHAMLGAAIPCMGGEVHACEHVIDDPEQTRRAVIDAAAVSDVIVSVGGISAGERDYFKSAYETIGAREVLHGVAIKPGKPIFVGQLSDHRARTIVALPGNPVSVLVTAHLFLWPILLRMLEIETGLPWETKKLAQSVRATGGRQSFRPVQRGSDGRSVEVLKWAGSGDLIHTAGSDGIVELPLCDGDVAPQTDLRFLPWSWLGR
jgi:molybdopterin molybdotransferase